MGNFIGKALSPVTSIIDRVIGGKAKPVKLPTAAPVATRDDAADAQARDDELRRRRGSASNMLLGPQGAEASAAQTATKLLTGQ